MAPVTQLPQVWWLKTWWPPVRRTDIMVSPLSSESDGFILFGPRRKLLSCESVCMPVVPFLFELHIYDSDILFIFKKYIIGQDWIRTARAELRTTEMTSGGAIFGTISSPQLQNTRSTRCLSISASPSLLKPTAAPTARHRVDLDQQPLARPPPRRSRHADTPR